MKYLLCILCLVLSGCNATPASRTFICVNPAMSLAGFQFESNDSAIKITSRTVEITTDSGAKIYLPRSLCMEIEKP